MLGVLSVEESEGKAVVEKRCCSGLRSIVFSTVSAVANDTDRSTHLLGYLLM